MIPHWPTYSPACQAAVTRLLRHGGSLSAYRSSPQFSLGPRAGSWAWRLERLIEKQAQVKHAVATNSGTMALQAMLASSGLPPKTRVVTSPYTFSATAAAILHAGMRLEFADVHLRTYCLDPQKVPEDIGAVVPVDLFGRIASRHYTVPILADSCQAAGAARGMNALAATWSMNGQKNIPAGEAGALLTDQDDLAERARRYISHGENWHHPTYGLNGRLNEITACVAYHGLLQLSANNAHRRKLAWILWNALRNEPRVQVLVPSEIEHHALYVYPFIVGPEVDRAAFVRRLREFGVEAGEGYIRPHLGYYPAFRAAMTRPLPVVEDLSERSLVLLYQVRPPTTLAQARYMARAIQAALDAHPCPRRSRMVRMEPTAF